MVDFREVLKGQSDGLLLLPTDKALLEDPAFRPFVELYARVKPENSIVSLFHFSVGDRSEFLWIIVILSGVGMRLLYY